MNATDLKSVLIRTLKAAARGASRELPAEATSLTDDEAATVNGGANPSQPRVVLSPRLDLVGITNPIPWPTPTPVPFNEGEPEPDPGIPYPGDPIPPDFTDAVSPEELASGLNFSGGGFSIGRL
jgi:hypothetical protein